jgi:hypothetical protein
MISTNTNKLIVPRLFSLLKSLTDSGVVTRKNQIIYFGTTIPDIKHQLMVRPNVTNRAINKPCV